MNDAAEIIDVPEIEKGIYIHYKNKRYEVLGVAVHSETHEPLVLYKTLYESPAEFWVRPYDMFTGYLEVNGKRVKRFTKIADSLT